MSARPADRAVIEALAELLSYPGGRTSDAARTVLDRGRGSLAESEVTVLVRFLGATGADRLQELYTSTFDLQPACVPYFGHHLLGEDSPLRGPLLAKLAEIYGGQGFTPREELGDHVAEVLRFVAVAPATPARDDLVRDGLLPGLRKMIESFEDEANPYRELLAVTERTVRTVIPEAGTVRGPVVERRAAR